MKKKTGIIAILMILMMIFAGCGSNENSASVSDENVGGTPGMDPRYEAPIEAARAMIEAGIYDEQLVPNDIGEAIGQGDADIYYALADLDFDGADELIMGYSLTDEAIIPGGVFTIRDDELYMLPLYMYSDILADGTIVVYGSEAAQQQEQCFELRGNGDLYQTEKTIDGSMEFEWSYI